MLDALKLFLVIFPTGLIIFFVYYMTFVPSISSAKDNWLHLFKSIRVAWRSKSLKPFKEERNGSNASVSKM